LMFWSGAQGIQAAQKRLYIFGGEKIGKLRGRVGYFDARFLRDIS